MPIDGSGIRVDREGDWNARKHRGTKRRGDRTHRCSARFPPLWPDNPATTKRLSPRKPRRNDDAPCEAAGATPHGAGFQPSSCRVPGPHPRGRPDRLSGPRHIHHESPRRGLSVTGQVRMSADLCKSSGHTALSRRRAAFRHQPPLGRCRTMLLDDRSSAAPGFSVLCKTSRAKR